MIISTKVGWGFVKNSLNEPNLDYDNLSKVSNLKDMRKANIGDESLKDDYQQLCKKSLIPSPGFIDPENDTSSESYAPYSDWQGPSGTTWIGQGYEE